MRSDTSLEKRCDFINSKYISPLKFNINSSLSVYKSSQIVPSTASSPLRALDAVA